MTILGPLVSEDQQSWASWTFISSVVLVSGLCIRGRLIRKELRRQVMEKIYLERYQNSAPQGDGQRPTLAMYRMVHEVDVMYAHRSCCCYPYDMTSHREQTEEPRPGDFCTCLWQTLASICCGACCGSWCQCFSMCAIGQEYREISREEKMDYITFEPYDEYYPKILNLRNDLAASWCAHVRALSKLAKGILKALAIFVLLLLALALSGIDSNFQPENLFVLLGTFFQAFSILYFAHWHWNRFHLSLDAVIKYFASGFVLCTGFALVYEMLIQLAMGILSYLVVIFGTVEEMENDPNAPEDPTGTDFSKYARQFMNDYPWVFGIFVFLNAFLVAAFVEELSKYFSWWMVDHPDCLQQDEVNAVPSKSTSASPMYVGVETSENGKELSGVSSGRGEEINNEAPVEASPLEDMQNQSQQRQRTLQSLSINITVGMVATALGFACCENLIYIFVYTPPTVTNELVILVLRSVFPIHPLAAAIQSVGVCERDLEGRKGVGIGRIILPAILLHGTYDFVLMIYAFILGVRQQDKLPTDDLQDQTTPPVNVEKELITQLPAMIVGFVIMILGVLYYVAKARSQRKRLAELESTRGGTNGPATTLFSIV